MMEVILESWNTTLLGIKCYMRQKQEKKVTMRGFEEERYVQQDQFEGDTSSANEP